MKPILQTEDDFQKKTIYRTKKKMLIKKWDKLNKKLVVSYYRIFHQSKYDSFLHPNPYPICVLLMQFSSPIFLDDEECAQGMMRIDGSPMWIGRNFFEELCFVFNSNKEE